MLKQLEAQKARLEQSSDRLQQLQVELAQVQAQTNTLSQEQHKQTDSV